VQKDHPQSGWGNEQQQQQRRQHRQHCLVTGNTQNSAHTWWNRRLPCSPNFLRARLRRDNGLCFPTGANSSMSYS
jgi:hypothetical protein